MGPRDYTFSILAGLLVGFVIWALLVGVTQVLALVGAINEVSPLRWPLITGAVVWLIVTLVVIALGQAMEAM